MTLKDYVQKRYQELVEAGYDEERAYGKAVIEWYEKYGVEGK